MRANARSVQNAALHYLRRFPSSSGNLRRVLKRKATRSDAFALIPAAELDAWIEHAVVAASHQGLLDDERYARALAESLHRRGLAWRMIARKLRDKLVAPELIEQIAAHFQADPLGTDLIAAWRLAAKKRLGCFRKAPEHRVQNRNRELAVLARAGFSYAIAKHVIDAATPPDEIF